MGVLGAPEIREIQLSPKERAEARTAYVKAFDRQFADWQGIARCCLEVKRDEDWKLLGFDCFEHWLHDAAPASERYLYLVMRIHGDLSKDIPAEALDTIPLGTAAILQRQVKSPAMRQDPRVLEAAKQKPKKFIDSLKTIAPTQHVETYLEKKLKFGLSQWETIADVLEAYRYMEDETMSLESLVEWLCNDWLDGLSDDQKTSRRMRWETLKEKRDAYRDNQGSQDEAHRTVVH